MKTVIEMAREAGIHVYSEFEVAFERLVELARADEREACAKLADEYATWGGSNFHDWFKKLSADIRARSKNT